LRIGLRHVDVDAQRIGLRQQAAAALELAKSTLARWEGLRKKDVVSQQDLDERRGALAQASAIWRRPTPTSSGCARPRASSALSRHLPA